MKMHFFSTIMAGLFLLASCKNSEPITPGGYKYTIVTEGSGDMPKAKDYVLFTLKITGDDGKVLQEMGEGPQMPIYQIPDTLPTGKEANPVIDIVVKSKKGGVYKLIMPVDSIPNAPVDILAMKHIVYEVTVKDIKNEAQYKEYMAAQQAEMEAKKAEAMQKLPAVEELVKTTLADYNAGKLEVQKTDSGLKYYIVKPGEGPNAAKGNIVTVNYYGSLMDGTKFDDSFSRGQSFPFTLGSGQVIKGWDEGIALLNKGAKAFFFIPSDMAYGDAGSPPVIPAKSDLTFYVELEDFK